MLRLLRVVVFQFTCLSVIFCINSACDQSKQNNDGEPINPKSYALNSELESGFPCASDGATVGINIEDFKCFFAGKFPNESVDDWMISNALDGNALVLFTLNGVNKIKKKNSGTTRWFASYRRDKGWENPKLYCATEDGCDFEPTQVMNIGSGRFLAVGFNKNSQALYSIYSLEKGWEKLSATLPVSVSVPTDGAYHRLDPSVVLNGNEALVTYRLEHESDADLRKFNKDAQLPSNYAVACRVDLTLTQHHCKVWSHEYVKGPILLYPALLSEQKFALLVKTYYRSQFYLHSANLAWHESEAPTLPKRFPVRSFGPGSRRGEVVLLYGVKSSLFAVSFSSQKGWQAAKNLGTQSPPVAASSLLTIDNRLGFALADQQHGLRYFQKQGDSWKHKSLTESEIEAVKLLNFAGRHVAVWIDRDSVWFNPQPVDGSSSSAKVIQANDGEQVLNVWAYENGEHQLQIVALFERRLISQSWTRETGWSNAKEEISLSSSQEFFFFPESYLHSESANNHGRGQEWLANNSFIALLYVKEALASGGFKDSLWGGKL